MFSTRVALTRSPDVIGIHLTQLAGPQAEEHGRDPRKKAPECGISRRASGARAATPCM